MQQHKAAESRIVLGDGEAGVVILTNLPFKGPPDLFDCCEWDPFFQKC